MAVSLTKDDVLALVGNRDSAAKILVTDKICKNYLEKIYTKDEIVLAHDIFRLLAHDIEMIVRKNLSENLKRSNDIPHDIALKLASDVEEVAIPMLEFSEVLTDEDLCEIIKLSIEQKNLAISHRRKLTPKVRDELISTSEPEILEEVFANDNIAQTESEYSDMIDAYAGNPAILKKIILRASIPMPIIEKMMNEVSSSIVTEVKKKYKIVPAAFERNASHSNEISLLSVIDHSSNSTEIEYLVDHLFNCGRLTPSIVLSSICMGKRRFFATALAKRAGIPKQNVEMLLKDGTLKALPALLHKAGLPEKLGDAVSLVIRLADEKKRNDHTINVRDYTKWLITRLEYFTDKFQIEYLSYIMAIAKQCQKS